MLYNYMYCKLLLTEEVPTTDVCRGRDRMIVRFTTTYAISAYHH